MAAIRIALLNIRLAMRTKVALFFTFIFPLIFLFAYGAIFARGNPAGMAFLFGPVVVLQVIGSSLWGLGMRSVAERERGSLRRYRLAPIGAGVMVLSSALASYLLLIPTVAVMLFCARVFFHMPMTISVLDLWILVTAGSFAFAGFGLTIGSVANTMQEAQVYNNIAFFPLLFLSGATIPLGALPHWLQAVAAFLPATYLVGAFQGVMSQSEPLLQHSVELGVLVVSGILGLMFAWKLFRWEKDEKIPRSGKLWALTFLAPFLAMGAWMNANGAAMAGWSRTLNSLDNSDQSRSAGPAVTTTGNGPFAIEHARVFDGVSVTPDETVVVEDGKIAAVGAAIEPPSGAQVIDGSGDTLLPGLIDAHVHVMARDALRQALVFGVTTDLDMFMDWHLAQQIRKEQSGGQGLDLADLRSAGTLVTAPGGHGTEYGMPIPTLSSPADAQAFVDARIAEGSDYIKIIDDDGSAYGIHFPTLSTAAIAAVVEAAHKGGKMAVAHIGSYQGAKDVLNAGVDGLMHLFIDRAPDPDFGRFVAAHHAFVVPTLSVLQGICGTPSGESLITDPDLGPYLPESVDGNLRQSFPQHPGEHCDYAAAETSIHLLQAADVPILAGTDAPNPGTTYGASLHGELELLVKAGLTPQAALVAATSAPAHAFHLDDRGRIAPGLRADLVLVKGDPTTDIKTTRKIVAVWKLGVEADRDAWHAKLQTANKSTAAAPAGSESGLVSDFDEGAPSAKFGSGWVKSTDSMMGGKSVVDFKMAEGGAENSKGSLEIDGDVLPGYAYPWAGAMFMPGAQPFAPANLSSKKTISFWAKGDGKTYRVMLFAASSGPIPAWQTFTAGSEWKHYSFPLASFQGMNGHDLEGVLFCGGPEPGKFALQIDDVRFD
jgi:imidazolonepropionase-like amidohydrolase/ABC-type multidrug transport system permease subunit